VLDLRVVCDRLVARVLEQLVVSELQHRAASLMAREHEGRRERVALQADSFRVAEVRRKGNRTHAAGEQLKHGDVQVETRYRRTTECGGPRRPTLDGGGLRAQPINEAASVRHMPAWYKHRHDPRWLKYMQERELADPLEWGMPLWRSRRSARLARGRRGWACYCSLASA
jgi:hypothetical protein